MNYSREVQLPLPTVLYRLGYNIFSLTPESFSRIKFSYETAGFISGGFRRIIFDKLFC
jgi:hypothetical protein